MLCVVTRRTRYCDRFGNFRVDKVSVTAFPAPVYETRPFKLGNQFPHLWWHKWVNEKGVDSVDRLPEEFRRPAGLIVRK